MSPWNDASEEGLLYSRSGWVRLALTVVLGGVVGLIPLALLLRVPVETAWTFEPQVNAYVGTEESTHGSEVHTFLALQALVLVVLQALLVYSCRVRAHSVTHPRRVESRGAYLGDGI
mmetsp:Transcript_57477/g.115170  ORF Transcript_57477/g.115170 Transcript_57477/m.115170 type:complete len:117 (-) Transcript_57477:285-635(-)